MRHESELAEAVREAAREIRKWTGGPVSRYFEGDQETPSGGPVEAHHAIGLIEGAAIALGLTPLELLDELRLEEND